MITTNKIHLKYFLGPGKAIFVEKQILIKGPPAEILRLTMNASNGDFLEHKHPKKLKGIPIYPPGDAALLTTCSPFYREMTNDTEVTEKYAPEDVKLKEKSPLVLKFPAKV